MSLYAELVRRHVIRVVVGYLAAAWLIVQVAETLLPVFDAPGNWIRVVVVLLAIGLPIVVALAWTLQLTPAGLRIDTGAASGDPPGSTRWLDRGIVLLLVLAVGYFSVDKFVLDPARDSVLVEEATEAGRVAAITGVYGSQSIVVLPFANLSGDPEQEYFADGLTEELLNVLAQTEHLRVISRTTAFMYKGRSVTVADVAKQLDVAHVLEGSVRRSGSRLRVTVQLIDGRTDTHLWSQNYDRDMGDVFAIQDDISAKVIAAIAPRLVGRVQSSARTDPEAYDLYLKAHQVLNQVDSSQTDQAIALLERALQLDPQFVAAIAELARAYYQKAQSADGEWIAKRDALVERLVDLDPDGARTNGWLGFIAMREQHDPAAAARYVERSLAAEPTGATTLRIAMEILRLQRRYREAIEIGKYVVERDPACGVCVDSLARVYRDAGLHREAAETLEAILEWRPADVQTLWSLGVAWLVSGRPDKALEAFEQDRSGQSEIGRLMALHDLGRNAEFEEALARLQREAEVNAEGVARVYAWIGDKDQAFAWLQATLEQDPSWANAIDTDLYAKLKDDPRWQELRNRFGAYEEDVLEWQSVPFDPILPGDLRNRL